MNMRCMKFILHLCYVVTVTVVSLQLPFTALLPVVSIEFSRILAEIVGHPGSFFACCLYFFGILYSMEVGIFRCSM